MSGKKEKLKKSKPAENCTFLPPRVSDDGAVRLPAVKLIYLPFGIMVDKFVLLLKLGSFYALLLSLVSFVFGYAYICNLPLVRNFPCAVGGSFLPLYFLFKYVLLLGFAVKWYQTAFLGCTLRWKNIFPVCRRDFLSMGLLAGFFLLNLAPVLSFYLLLIREPNPDAAIEVAYFACVSVGFLVPFAVMRFYSLFGLAVEGCRLPSWSEVWQLSRGNTLRILIALFFIFFLTLFAFLNFYLLMRGYETQSTLWLGISSEFVYDLMLLMLLSLFVNHCYIQKLFMFGETVNETND